MIFNPKPNHMIKKTLKKIVDNLGYVIFKKKAIRFTGAKFGVNAPILQDGISYIKQLESKFKKISIVQHLEGFIIDIDKYRLYIKTTEELFILKEILVDDCYNFIASKPTIVFDVGMNIGIASIFFASKSKVEKIFSFEPVPATFKQGLENFELNSSIRHKILAHNFGLSIKDHDTFFTFNSKYKGSVGCINAKSIVNDKKHNSSIAVKLKEIKNQFSEIIKESPTIDFVLKMDCEGGEYELIPALNEEGLLSKFRIIMLEYHKGEHEKIAAILLKNNFQILQKTSSSELGMLYAFKS